MSEFKSYIPRLIDDDFNQGLDAIPLNPDELEYLADKLWAVLKPQIMTFGVSGLNISGSSLLGYIWGFVDGYLQEFDPCPKSDLENIISSITFTYFREVDIAKVEPEKLNNQIAEENKEFFDALNYGGHDGKCFAENNLFRPDGLVAIFDANSRPADEEEQSSAYRLGTKFAELSNKVQTTNIFDTLKSSLSPTGFEDDDVYEYSLTEFESGQLKRGVWAKALSEADGDEAKAKGLYIKLRARQIKERNIASQRAEKVAKERQNEELLKLRAEIENREREAAKKLQAMAKIDQKQKVIKDLENAPEKLGSGVSFVFILVFFSLFGFVVGALVDWDFKLVIDHILKTIG